MTSNPDPRFHLYDTTLRDGAQREGISYSVTDKLAVARLLDELGVGYIEGGWPGAMPKDTEFFARASKEIEFRNAALVAFGATRKPGTKVEDDAQVRALIDSAAPVITLVAKSHLWHVTDALRTTGEENLAMVSDTVAYLTSLGRRVFLDCEHFFDGYLAHPEYALAVVQAGFAAGAEVVILCDTNGGMLPLGIADVVATVVAATGAVREGTGPRIGIHCQDDTGCAVANTVSAVQAGASHAQCTANGYGERTGNADLFAVTANLVTKMGIPALPPGKLADMTRVSHALAEIANIAPNTHQAYVGTSAFAHKAGLHASAIKVSPELYNHIDPAIVGNDMRMLVSEMAGRASVELKGRELGVDLSARPEVLGRVVQRVKELEAAGWTFEAADASFELLLHSEISGSPVSERYFTVESWRTIVEQRPDGEVVSEATVKVRVGDERIVATGEGNGPVNALDNALRKALIGGYPELRRLELTDYKVRILDGVTGTDAVTRVLVETTDLASGPGDPSRTWDTVGVHENVVAASWNALADALAYGMLRARSAEQGASASG